MIEIKNLRNEKMKYMYDFRVDRASILGNKFYMHTETERKLVCDKYEKYFNEILLNRADCLLLLHNMLQTYKKYGKLRLFCWCAPKQCHAETIKKFLESEV